MAGEQKRDREYVRVPSAMVADLQSQAASYDVPMQSLTRLVLCLGLEMLKVDPLFTREALSRLSAPQVPTQ